MSTQQGQGPSKFDKAVNAARHKDEGNKEEPGQAILPRGAAVMIVKPTAEEIAAAMGDESMEFAPQVHSLEEGEMIMGILEGKGPSTTFTQEDPFTKMMVSRPVDTWIIASARRAADGSWIATGLRMSILSSIQLDKKLPPCIGAYVKIFRGKEVRTSKGFRVTDYMVSVERKKDGGSRSWVRPLEAIDVPSRAIDAPAAAPQLSDGSHPAGGEDAA